MERFICQAKLLRCQYQGNTVYTDKGEFKRCRMGDIDQGDGELYKWYCSNAVKLPEAEEGIITK